MKDTNQQSPSSLYKRLLAVRDELVKGNYDEAYHQLCMAADPDLCNLNHWAEWERLASPSSYREGEKKPDFPEWIKSEQGQQCADMSTLTGEEYLKNRLFWAFDAGRDCVWQQYMEQKSKIEHLEEQLEEYRKGLSTSQGSERILCAAIWYDDGQEHTHQPLNIKRGFVVSGRRHHNIIHVVSGILGFKWFEIHQTQGFITTSDRFVNREDALNIAILAGQVQRAQYGPRLYSEDLY